MQYLFHPQQLKYVTVIKTLFLSMCFHYYITNLENFSPHFINLKTYPINNNLRMGTPAVSHVGSLRYVAHLKSEIVAFFR